MPVLGISQELDAEAELIGTLKRDSPTGGGSKPMVAVAPFDLAQVTSPHNRNKVEFGAPANPLTASGFSDPCVAFAFAMRGRAEGNVPEVAGDVANALRGASGGSTRDMIAFATTDYRTGSFAETGISGPPTDAPDRSRAATLVNPVTYAVRRLTPRECERLQGLPDDWTELGHYYEDFNRERLWNAKTRTRPKGEEAEAIVRKIADTHRYRLCGNAVTVNVAEWLGHRVTAALTADELEEAA